MLKFHYATYFISTLTPYRIDIFLLFSVINLRVAMRDICHQKKLQIKKYWHCADLARLIVPSPHSRARAIQAGCLVKRVFYRRNCNWRNWSIYLICGIMRCKDVCSYIAALQLLNILYNHILAYLLFFILPFHMNNVE